MVGGTAIDCSLSRHLDSQGLPRPAQTDGTGRHFVVGVWLLKSEIPS